MKLASLPRLLRGPGPQDARRRRSRHFAIAERLGELGVWTCNYAEDRMELSDGALDLFGLEPQSFDGSARCVRQLVHPADRIRLERVRTQAALGSHVFELQFRIRRGDGGERRVRARGRISFGESGQPLNSSGVIIDESEHPLSRIPVLLSEEFEAYWRDSNIPGGDILRIREEFRTLQRMQTVGQLSSGMAHDFNNLLTVILGNAEELRDKLQGEPALADLAEMTRAAAARGSELTGRLLAYVRKSSHEPLPTDVGQLIESMAPLLKATIGVQIDFAMNAREGIGAAVVDPGRLESALLNLAINARDAMPSGGKLMVSMECAAPGSLGESCAGEYIVITVADTGVGMPEAVRLRAHEPFFTTKERGKGTGLGLTMVHGLVNELKGRMEINSTENAGTSVRLFLPKAPQPETPSSKEEPEAAPAGGDERILLVEDDDLVRGHILSQLRTLGYSVVEARNGREALSAVRADPGIDLMLVDIILPGDMTGVALAELVERQRPSIGIVLMSGHVDDTLARRAPFGAERRFIRKPFRRSELNGLLRAAFDATAVTAGSTGR